MLARKALAGTAGAPKAYVEEVFSTYLYTGNGTGKSIQNDIKLGASYSGTTLKLNFDSNNTDSANSFTPTVTGTAGYSTADAKFGAGSCAGFDAASWLDYNPNAGNFGSGDWTVEFWVKTSSGNGPGIVTQAFAAGAANTSWGFFVGYGTSGNIAFYLSDGSSYFASITSGTTAVNNNTWNHVAACRSGSTVYLFLNGVSQGTASVGTTALGNGGAPVRIGGQGTSYSMPSGTYIDDVRIIKGTALYTSGFTPPSAATNTTSYPPTTTAGEGGLVWTKSRSNATGHILFDTQRGLGTSGNRPDLHTELQDGQVISGEGISSFNSDGYTLENTVSSNGSARTFVSWTFRKAKKFFDVVTFTTNSSEPPNTGDISHNLGSTPGCVIVKKTSGSQDWKIYHRSLSTPTNKYLQFDTTAVNDAGTAWINVSSTTISFPGTMLDNSSTYVAYLFAHDAGGFGDAGSDSIIKCGSYTGNGSTTGPTVTLDWEPQWLMIKASSTTGSWQMIDNMRGMVVSGNDQRLIANSSSAELSNNYLSPTATGFELVSDSSEVNGSSQTYIYIAIRRGPMKTPTSGTSVFAIDTLDGTTLPAFVSGFPVDMAIQRYNINTVDDPQVATRLLQATQLLTSSTAVESSASLKTFDFNNGYDSRTGTSSNWYSWMFRRAPGFFDVVCYTGTGSNRTVSHNLGVVPELIIVKNRGVGENWAVYNSSDGNTKWMQLNTTTASAAASTIWNNTSPTSSVFSVGTSSSVNGSSETYVAYLFASLSGVSKVGSYTGNGSSQTINCNFTAGSRFIMIKRTDSTGDWKVIDTARGIVSGNDPTLALNSTAAEVTGTDCIDPDNSGFIVNQETTNNLNVNNATYIYLSVA